MIEVMSKLISVRNAATSVFNSRRH